MTQKCFYHCIEPESISVFAIDEAITCYSLQDIGTHDALPDHNKQKVGKDLPERKPGGNCIWQRPICPLWTLKVTDCSALSLHCFVLPRNLIP